MNALRVVLALAVTALVVVPSAIAAEPAGRVRASITTKGDVWVGQRVTLVVELLAPGFFSGAPSFDLPQVPGVVILKPDDRPTLGSETIDDVSYTVQRHELAIYAERRGTVAVPGFVVRFEANAGFGKPMKSYSVTTPPISFTAKIPPGADKLATVVTTTQLTVKEMWTPKPGAAQVGAAFTRTITVEARDVPGMVLPSFAFDPPDGFRAYPKAPEISDRIDRGELTGRRVETVAYVCEQPGTYSLPALVLAWWNPQEQKLNRAKLPARTFEVIAPPQPPVPAPVSPTDVMRQEWTWPVVVGVLLVAFVAWRFGSATAEQWKKRRARAAESEHAYFIAFKRACRTGDAHTIYRALVAWLDRFSTDRPARLDEFARTVSDPVLASQLTALQDAVFGSAPDMNRPAFSGAELTRRIRSARTRLLRLAGEAARHEPELPPLNPS